MIQKGFNDEYGARPLKRFIQRQIETFVATKIIDGTIIPGISYELILDNEQLKLIPNEKGSN